MVFWSYWHSCWSYITISSYAIIEYLHDFTQCLHWFYPLIRLGFYLILFLLLRLPVSSNVQIIIHKLVPLQDHNITFFGYLQDFPQCMHWFYPLIHLGFHSLLFLLLGLFVFSNVQIIIHKLYRKALKFKIPLCLYIYLNLWFVCYIPFIKLDK